MGFELNVSSKTTVRYKPRIKKGYYVGKLVSVTLPKTKDGAAVESKYGRQFIMRFAILKEDRETAVTWKPADNIEEDVMLDYWAYYEWKNAKTGEAQTAITPKSRTTAAFQALGWKFDDTKKLVVDDYIGRLCEINIDDYDATYTDKDGKKEIYKASTVKDIGVLEGYHPNEKQSTLITEEEFDKKIRELTEQHSKGMISDQGYQMALDQLGKQRNG